MTRIITKDWTFEESAKANGLDLRLRATLPKQWGRKIDLLAVHPESVPYWRRTGAWLERLQAFRDRHANTLEWSMSDAAICQSARDIAEKVNDLLGLWEQAGAAVKAGAVAPAFAGMAPGGPLSEAEQLDLVRVVCGTVGVPDPVALTGAGAVARACSETWWRRSLRKQAARTVEHGAIVAGLVNRRDGVYASNDAVKRRADQLARNEAMLKNSLMRNEAGQVFTLAKLAEKSTANPDVRRGELMTRIRGCEEFADEQEHRGVFFTLTCPSRFHAVLSGGKGRGAKPTNNPKYQGATPRDAQQWLCKQWARVRAEWARRGIKAYGFRVAEPHADSTPHWHALLWFEDGAAVSAAVPVVSKHWLSDDGGERGAAKNRVNVKGMVSGSAAGYIAKYIAKNIAGGSVAVDGHTDDGIVVAAGDKGAARVDAWASTWGIRQFQSIGQPSVTVWREMRRVTKDQIESARVGGDVEAWKAHGAVHKVGTVMACWKRFMRAMGGVCLKREEYLLQPAKRCNEVVNAYGETVTQKIVVGVVLRSGRWLVSRRQAWARAEQGAALGEGASAGGTPAPWSGFNNCTARLTGQLRAALMNLQGGAYGMGGA